jgi:hypothetical protein
MANMNEHMEQDESMVEKKGASFAETVVTIFMALFIIFIFLQIVFL